MMTDSVPEFPPGALEPLTWAGDFGAIERILRAVLREILVVLPRAGRHGLRASGCIEVSVPDREPALNRNHSRLSRPGLSLRGLRLAAGLGLLALVPLPASAVDSAWQSPALTLEVDAAWQLRNSARIANRSPNTRFDIEAITGEGPYASGRLMLDWPLDGPHHLRFLIAPLGLDERGLTEEPIVFQDTVFEAGQLAVKYRFDSYRATYRYTFHDSDRWTWSGGATLKIRDAEIELRQGELRRRKANTGVVPLLALYGEWRFAGGWTGVLDFEGLGASQGRAIDVAVKVGYDLTSRLNLHAGYRLLDGGADNEDLYTFARFDSALLGLTWAFR